MLSFYRIYIYSTPFSISLYFSSHDMTWLDNFSFISWTRSLELEFSNLLSEFQLTFYIWKHLVQNSFLVATWPLDQAWGFQSSRNNLQWLGMTHWKPLEVLGTLRKSHKLPESLADDLRVSLTFPSILYQYETLLIPKINHFLLILHCSLSWEFLLKLYVLIHIIKKIYQLALYLL